MRLLRYFLRNITLLNVILLAVAVATAGYTFPSLLKTDMKFRLPVFKQAGTEEERESPEVEPPALSDYKIIADSYVFHPERKIPAEKKESATPQVKEVKRPNFMFFGTMVKDNLSIAYLQDKNSTYATQSGRTKQLALRKGDTISGYTLQDIDEERVVLSNGQDTIVVNLKAQGSKERETPEAALPQTTQRMPGQRRPPLRTLQSAQENRAAVPTPQRKVLNMQPDHNQMQPPAGARTN